MEKRSLKQVSAVVRGKPQNIDLEVYTVGNRQEETECERHEF